MNQADRSERSGAALVIGGTGAIGQAICRRLPQDFDAIFFTYRNNRDAADSLERELGETCTTGSAAIDLRDAQAVERLIGRAEKKVGPIRSLLFASGVSIDQPYVSQIDVAAWREVIDTEVFGFIHIVRAMLPVFRREGRGAFVNIGSFATRWFPPGDALSAVPKAATEMLCRAIAREEGRYGIRANTVAPGIINAGIGATLMETHLTPAAWQQQERKVALRRFGTSQEVAEVAAFLASDRSRYVTGETIIVDGGLHL